MTLAISKQSSVVEEEGLYQEDLVPCLTPGTTSSSSSECSTESAWEIIKQSPQVIEKFVNEISFTRVSVTARCAVGSTAGPPGLLGVPIINNYGTKFNNVQIHSNVSLLSWASALTLQL